MAIFLVLIFLRHTLYFEHFIYILMKPIAFHFFLIAKFTLSKIIDYLFQRYHIISYSRCFDFTLWICNFVIFYYIPEQTRNSLLFSVSTCSIFFPLIKWLCFGNFTCCTKIWFMPWIRGSAIFIDNNCQRCTSRHLFFYILFPIFFYL